MEFLSKTKFKPKKRQAEVLEKLNAELSKKVGIEEKILHKQTKRAIKNWEKATKVKTVNLFKSEPHHISAIIPHLLTYFETEFVPIMETTEDLDIALKIANQALYDMYDLDTNL